VFPAERVAISGLDAEAAEVLVNLVSAATLPDEGSVRVLGRNTGSIEDAAAWFESLEKIGIVTGRAVLLEGLTVLQNMALPFSLEIEPVSEQVTRQVEGLAAEVGLGVGLLGRRMGDALPDDRLRVQIARALASEPVILLLEHPTASVSRETMPRVTRDLVRAVRGRDLALLAITEDRAFAAAVADRVLLLHPASGRVAPRPRWTDWF
jgi:ABC-type lipoprotein export system ATPase subunit